MKSLALVLLLLLAVPAYADDSICTDRPGAGSDFCILKPGLAQVEMGTDGQEIRYGLTHNLEIFQSDTTYGMKYNVYNDQKFGISVRPQYDYNNVFSIEVPMQYTFNDKFNLSMDISKQQHTNYYQSAMALNYNVTPEYTVSAGVYTDKNRVYRQESITWIPASNQTLQLDAGFTNNKLYFGISKYFKF